MNNALLKKIGKNIKKYRKLIGYTQESLAEKLEIHSTTISRFERGKINFPILTLNIIANALGVDIKDLFEK